MTTPWNQYSTVAPLAGALSSVYSETDAVRLASYDIYERMYWGVPNTFRLSQRGSDASPVYIPAPKTIIETTNRFLAVGLRGVVPPEVGSPDGVATLQLLLDGLMKREQMFTKFGTQKRYGLIRGDAVWHVVANADKAEGTRVSVYEVDPAEYFPIYDDNQIDRIVGCHLVQPMDPDPKTNTERVKRQTYRKMEDGTIINSIEIYEAAYWDDRPDALNKKDGVPELHRIAVLKPETPLPDAITALPVYHVRNTRQAGFGFGSSELRGMERILSSINQTMSDAELSLALDGLGLYTTTSGPPEDENGEVVPWNLGPGKVVEIQQDSAFNRVSGIASVAPYTDFKNSLMESMYDASAIPDVARGNVDVSIAESGIALYLRMGPILAKNAEKEVEMLGTLQHMFFDLSTMWFPEYEGFSADSGARAEPIVGDPIPLNRKGKIDEIIALFEKKIAPYSWVKEELALLGIVLPDDAEEQIATSTKASEQLLADPYGDRLNSEGAGATGDEEVVDDGATR